MQRFRGLIAVAALLLGGWWLGFAVLATVHAASHAIAVSTETTSETGVCGVCLLGSDPAGTGPQHRTVPPEPLMGAVIAATESNVLVGERSSRPERCASRAPPAFSS